MSYLPILNTVSARELQRDYKSIFIKAKKTKEPIMVIGNNEPQIIMLSPDTFKRYSDSLSRQELWETIASIQADNPNTNEKEVEADVLAAIKRVRMKVYGKSPRRSR
ncbi:MAG: type II toxin-antitoxin system Phd/YefM family antitoxin [bacterium]